jgi:hypothetical protein
VWGEAAGLVGHGDGVNGVVRLESCAGLLVVGLLPECGLGVEVKECVV